MEVQPQAEVSSARSLPTGGSGPSVLRWIIAGSAVVATASAVATFWLSQTSLIPAAYSRAPQIKVKPAASDGFTPTPSQWASLTVETVSPRSFRTTVTTDGRITIDEDRTTPIFSPYAGRVISLHAKPGDQIEAGHPLFTIAASDMVQAQNDVVGAVAALNKANSAFRLAEINLTRARNLYESKAGSQRDYQAAEDARTATQSDKSAAEAALEAARNRLRLFGKSDEEIDVFQKEGRITSETVIKSPISGTVVQRKVGPGQYVAGAQSDPVFVIGDLTAVWIVANVKETDSPSMRVGSPIEFRVLALPGKTFSSKISYIASSVDPSTRRLTVRAEIGNPDGLLKPEMFAMVDIVASDAKDAPSIPRGALIYDGEAAHVWAVRADKSVVKRPIRVGIGTADKVQVVDGLSSGDRIISKGGLFIDRLSGTTE